ncbi:hypothetical protein CFP65_3305 [Kitasatospora sp. MMS16-BH015]|uniref:hypothetical protein n=1 Tax=Kitasatospora sp. MMS16-BH015 TaxID=2018025 RepID=UPI000CA2A252|nr:hypothetical protein [Kitasatospora sp. MMS16-BH015]AUG78105.1 hypothetical protein CFP65_3305 [Kitasatospora sp. MMS16-BH015]
MTDSTRRTLRTAVQTLLGLLTALPLLVSTAGLPATLPGLGVALAVATAVTRVMALPVVENLLPTWLRTPTAAPAAPTTPEVTTE